MAMTAPTPMMIPSMVRLERILLRPRALKAMRRVMEKFMRSPSSAVAGSWLRSSAACRGWIRVVLDHFSVPEDHMPAGITGDVRFMGHQDDGDPGLLVELLEDFHDLQARAGVQVPRGFIGQNQGGLVHKSAGDGHALLLAAGELAGKMMFPPLKAHLLIRTPWRARRLSREELSL